MNIRIKKNSRCENEETISQTTCSDVVHAAGIHGNLWEAGGTNNAKDEGALGYLLVSGGFRRKSSPHIETMFGKYFLIV